MKRKPGDGMEEKMLFRFRDTEGLGFVELREDNVLEAVDLVDTTRLRPFVSGCLAP